MRWISVLALLIAGWACVRPAAYGEGRSADVFVRVHTGPQTKYSEVVRILDGVRKIDGVRLALGTAELPAGEFTATVTFDRGTSWFGVVKLSADLRKAGIGRIRFAPGQE